MEQHLKAPEYQLKVGYPLNGVHFFLRWYEQGEGHHVIVSRSTNGIRHVFNSVLAHFGDVEVKEYVCVQLVAPDEKLVEIHAKARFEEDMQSFWYTISYLAKEFYAQYARLPSGLKFCSSWAARYAEDEDDEHNECYNCTQRITPSIGTKESVFLEKRDAFRKVHPHWSTLRKDNEYVSRAKVHDPSTQQFCATADFGHHRDGVFLTDADTAGKTDAKLFYYQNPVSLNNKEFVDMTVAAKEKYKKKQSENTNRFALRGEELREKENKFLLSLFDENNKETVADDD